MSLFFETSDQARSFLTAIPLGFFVALCLDTGKWGGGFRVVLDLLLIALGAMSLLILSFLTHDTWIRLYHLLGMVCGAVLYLHGIAQVKKRMINQMQRWKKKRCMQENHSPGANS